MINRVAGQTCGGPGDVGFFVTTMFVPPATVFPSLFERLEVDVRTDPEFDRFFCSHYSGIVRSLTLITGDTETAADCAQEAFVRAYARWRRVRRYDNPAAWVRRVAINLARDRHRSDERRRRREDRFEADGGCVVAGPSEQIVAGLSVIELLGRLPRQQQSVAALFYVEDLSVNEIADVLGLSTGAVKFHLHRARAALRSVVDISDGDRA